MAKFSFPVPGRKKHQPPQVLVTAPATSKAQRILGSNALNIDAPRSWDDMSNSAISIMVSESTAPTSYASTVRDVSNHDRGFVKSEREWGDESEALPRHLRLNGLPDDESTFRSDMSSVMRKRQSSSTLASWYDKSKQPLAISQQTSASAMAKGLPSKAQRMLDMDNAQAEAKSKKKKPGRLDFSHLMSRSRGKKEAQQQQQQTWQDPILASDHVTNSPSIMSPLTPPPIRSRTGGLTGKLRKRPTKESLRSVNSIQSEPARPITSGSNRRGPNHLNGLPNLYEHYEQMSFRQVMEVRQPSEEVKPSQIDTRSIDVRSQVDTRSIDVRSQASIRSSIKSFAKSAKPAKPIHIASHHEQQVISDYASRHLPQTPQSPFMKKPEQSSPIDCAASVSSRHTRTSKASKRTDQSFQESDLLEKSVLSLSSSDSEEDVYVEPSLRSPVSASHRRPSDATSASDHRPTTARTTDSADNNRFSRSSKASKRTTFSQTNTYLTIPNGHSNKLPTINDRSSLVSESSTNTIQESAAPQSPSTRASGVSVVSNSSANTTMTWQSKPGFGVQEARAITLIPAEGPTESESDAEQDPENDSVASMMPRDSLVNSADQPTPPLSPSSVDFYIRSAHSSIDGQGNGHNRFMAVTRQEEMLLAALRHKRQVMRETILSEYEDGGRAEKRATKGHSSKGSEATITDTNFEFDFPAPPTYKDKTTPSPDGTPLIDVRDDSDQKHSQRADHPTHKHDHTHIVTPVPKRHSPKSILKKGPPESPDDDRHERILLYLDRPIAAEHQISIEEAEPSPDLSDFMEFDEESTDSEIVSEVFLYAQQRRLSDRSSRHNHQHKGRPQLSGPSSLLNQASKMLRTPETNIMAEEAGVPRPDSPISPEGLGAPPTKRSTVNKKTARLSAVGPARWGNED
ncbi:hypothetical protein G7046_g1214 [Stylonectria norvegica]|nr:hypothetical protein G7046_g1214 [Stylonectria norvegica]